MPKCSLAFSLIGSPSRFLPFHFSYTLDYIHVYYRADVLMLVVVMVSLGRCCSGSVRRRSWLGLAGVGIVVAAGLAAYGINSGFGKKARAQKKQKKYNQKTIQTPAQTFPNLTGSILFPCPCVTATSFGTLSVPPPPPAMIQCFV